MQYTGDKSWIKILQINYIHMLFQIIGFLKKYLDFCFIEVCQKESSLSYSIPKDVFKLGADNK